MLEFSNHHVLKVSYFAFSCGTTTCSKIPHETAFQGIHGDRQIRSQPQPEVAGFIYRNLPQIDEHNNKRQGELSLETCWPTKDGWFRLMTTYIGMSVTNLRNAMDYFQDQNMTVIEMANSISAGLKIRARKNDALNNQGCGKLRRIHDEEGGIRRKNVTQRQLFAGRSVGSGVQRSCHICRQYYKKHRFSSFVCSKCDTCVCKIDR